MMKGSFVFRLVGNKYFVSSLRVCPSPIQWYVCVSAQASYLYSVYCSVSQSKAEMALWEVWDEAIRLYLVIDYLILKVTAHSDLRGMVVLLESELMA